MEDLAKFGYVLMICEVLVFGFSQSMNIVQDTYGNHNWTLIPNAWDGYLSVGHLIHGPDPQIVFVDSNVTHNGDVSIRVNGPATSGNPCREIDAYNTTAGAYSHIQVKPGDRVVYSVWMKTSPSTSGYTEAGAYFGVDLYGPSGRIWEVSYGYPGTTDFMTVNYNAYKYVPYNTPTWTKGTIDFIVPNKTFTVNSEGHAITAQIPNGIVPWIATEPFYPSSESGPVWFSDAELYINPSNSTAPPISYPGPGTPNPPSNNPPATTNTTQNVPYPTYQNPTSPSASNSTETQENTSTSNLTGAYVFTVVAGLGCVIIAKRKKKEE